MANITGLSAPVVGDDKGTYPTKITDSFTALDNHDHSTGKGVAIGAAGLASASVTGAKLDTSAADASTLEVASGSMRVKDGGITPSKFSSVPVVSSSSGDFFDHSGSAVDVTNLSVTITAVANRPILIHLIADGTVGSPAAIGSRNQGGSASNISNSTFILMEDGVSIAEFYINHNYGSSTVTTYEIEVPPGAINHMRIGATAGSRTYKLQAKSQDAGFDVRVVNCKLVAMVL